MPDNHETTGQSGPVPKRPYWKAWLSGDKDPADEHANDQSTLLDGHSEEEPKPSGLLQKYFWTKKLSQEERDERIRNEIKKASRRLRKTGVGEVYDHENLGGFFKGEGFSRRDAESEAGGDAEDRDGNDSFMLERKQGSDNDNRSMIISVDNSGRGGSRRQSLVISRDAGNARWAGQESVNHNRLSLAQTIETIGEFFNNLLRSGGGHPPKDEFRSSNVMDPFNKESFDPHARSSLNEGSIVSPVDSMFTSAGTDKLSFNDLERSDASVVHPPSEMGEAQAPSLDQSLVDGIDDIPRNSRLDNAEEGFQGPSGPRMHNGPSHHATKFDPDQGAPRFVEGFEAEVCNADDDDGFNDERVGMANSVSILPRAYEEKAPSISTAGGSGFYQNPQFNDSGVDLSENWNPAGKLNDPGDRDSFSSLPGTSAEGSFVSSYDQSIFLVAVLSLTEPPQVASTNN